MIIQAYEYESDQKLFPKLQMFYDSTEGSCILTLFPLFSRQALVKCPCAWTGAFSHPQIKEIVAELMRRRALLKK